MSLRQNALVLAVLTALIAIAGAWSGDASLAGLWRLPLALLLLGLAYEAWMTSRAMLGMTIEPDQRSVLGRSEALRLRLHHRLGRDTLVELAPDAPAVVEVDSTVQILVARAGEGTQAQLRITPRRLGEHAWPDMR